MKPQLAVIRGCTLTVEDNGKIVEIICSLRQGEEWVSSAGSTFRSDNRSRYAVRSLGGPFKLSADRLDMECVFVSRVVFPINDNPGNEQFVTEARNKLHGNTEITEKGEVRV